MGLDNGWAPNMRQAIIWTNADLIHWRIYAALVGDELKNEGCYEPRGMLWTHFVKYDVMVGKYKNQLLSKDICSAKNS